MEIIDQFQWETKLDASVFNPNVPADSNGGQIVSTSENYDNMNDEEKAVSKLVKEDVEKFFKACTEEDWDEASKYLQNVKENQRVKEILGELEVNFIEEPYISDSDPTVWLVPYSIKFSNGAVQVNTMGLKMNSSTGTFSVRFGF